MTRLRPRRGPALVPVVASALAAMAVGCGGPAVVDRGELENQVQAKLTESVGQEAPKATCPNELKAEKGATTRCSMNFDDGELGITVTVSSVDGDTTKFAIKADEELR